MKAKEFFYLIWYSIVLEPLKEIKNMIINPKMLAQLLFIIFLICLFFNQYLYAKIILAALIIVYIWKINVDAEWKKDFEKRLKKKEDGRN